MTRGHFIVLEGIDGAGTTTQTARLCADLQRRGHSVHPTCEPSRGPIGVALRRVLQGEEKLPADAMALLFAADRLDHLAREIEPRLAAGVHVVSDRYTLSSLAYQSIDVDRSFVAAINGRAPAPDLTLFVDVDAAIAAERRRTRGGPPELYDALEFQRRVAEGYRREAQLQHRDHAIVTIDGNRDEETVFGALLAAVETCLPALGRSLSKP